LPSGHHCTTLLGYIFATKAHIDIGKKLVRQQYVLHMSPQYGELRPTSGSDRLTSLGHPCKFQLVSHSHLGSVTARHLVVGVSHFATLNRGRHLYSAGQPSRWALAHISSFFCLFSSPNGCRPYFHTWCGLSANLECMPEMCCTWIAENTGRKNYAKNCHLRTIAQLCWALYLQLRHVLTIGKKLVKWQYLLHMSLQYRELQPTNVWDLLAGLGHPSKLQRVVRLGFVTSVALFTGGQPNFTRFSRAFVAWRNFYRCKLHFLSKSYVLLYWQRYCTALEQWASAKLCGVVQEMELRNFCSRRHLYLAGRPSQWALAHILVLLGRFSKTAKSFLKRQHKAWNNLLNTGVTPNKVSNKVFNDRFSWHLPDFWSIAWHFPDRCQIPWHF